MLFLEFLFDPQPSWLTAMAGHSTVPTRKVRFGNMPASEGLNLSRFPLLYIICTSYNSTDWPIADDGSSVRLPDRRGEVIREKPGPSLRPSLLTVSTGNMHCCFVSTLLDHLSRGDVFRFHHSPILLQAWRHPSLTHIDLQGHGNVGRPVQDRQRTAAA